MRGAALIDLGRLEEAESELKDADRISERKLDLVHIQLARLYEKRGERRRAADELERYLRQNPNAENAAAIREAVKKLRAK
jgi:tetratricopeptide (TPR) repeat protein